MKSRPFPGNVRRANSSRNNNRRTLTNKNGRLVECENMLQRQLALQLEYDLSIVDYGSFPEEFYYVDHHGNRAVYIPFVKVWRKDGQIEIRDVVPHERRIKREFSLCEREMDLLCRSRGWTYIVETEHTLMSATAHANLEMIQLNAPTAYADAKIIECIYEYLRDEKRVPVTVLRQQIALDLDAAPGDVFSTIAHMIWHQYLNINLTEELLIIDGYLNPRCITWISK